MIFCTIWYFSYEIINRFLNYCKFFKASFKLNNISKQNIIWDESLTEAGVSYSNLKNPITQINWENKIDENNFYFKIMSIVVLETYLTISMN